MNESLTRDFLTCSLSTNVFKNLKQKSILKGLLKIRSNFNFLKIPKYHLINV